MPQELHWLSRVFRANYDTLEYRMQILQSDKLIYLDYTVSIR